MKRLIDFIRYKNCPWCGQKIKFFDLIYLDAFKSTQCKKCRKFYRNSIINHILSIITPFILLVIPIFWFELSAFLVIPIGFFIMLYIGVLAEPVKLESGKT